MLYKIDLAIVESSSYNLLPFQMTIPIYFLLLCLLQSPPIFSCKPFDILKGSSLSVEKPSHNLVSADGDFSAGFFSVGDNTFCFAIWFTRPSVDPIVVWMANRDDPVDGRGSKLSLLKDGKLILTNSAGNTIWSTPAASTSSEASNLQLQLLNTGNLILHNSDQSVFIWQSFDTPTDTLLPLQKLTRVSGLISKKANLTILQATISSNLMMKTCSACFTKVQQYPVSTGQLHGLMTMDHSEGPSTTLVEMLY
jgi:hypothetical protein